MSVIVIVVLSVAAALVFDLINGFHDSANSIATVVSTRVLSPRLAVVWAAFFNFVAMFIFVPHVADTISKIVIIDSGDPAYIYVVLSALVGAIIWDLLTWYWGLPTSSSHALIGGLVGAGITHKGLGVIMWQLVISTIVYVPAAPIMGFALGFSIMVIVFWLFRRWRPATVDNFFRKGQLFSAALYSLGHGGNDAQKTMGVIVALFIAAGIFSPETKLSLLDWRTLWIILSCQLAMAMGTAMGGWRIVKTMGMRITKLKPVGGFCAETAGAATLFAVTHMGIPVSTTHTITGAIVGVGSTTKFSTIKWGVARSIIWAWVLTIPLSAIVSAAFFYIISLIHPGF
jgi:PiT family inorganic phosphate transporter